MRLRDLPETATVLDGPTRGYCMVPAPSSKTVALASVADGPLDKMKGGSPPAWQVLPSHGGSCRRLMVPGGQGVCIPDGLCVDYSFLLADAGGSSCGLH